MQIIKDHLLNGKYVCEVVREVKPAQGFTQQADWVRIYLADGRRVVIDQVTGTIDVFDAVPAFEESGTADD